MVWSGWDFGAGTDNSDLNLTIALPMAKNPDGSSITGPAYDTSWCPSRRFVRAELSRRDLDTTKATLTHRVHLDDPPQAIPASGWEYAETAGLFGCFPRGKGFVANDIYELSYTAKDPSVNGIGFAAVRDFNSFLRYAAADRAGTSNPLAGDVTRIYTFTVLAARPHAE